MNTEALQQQLFTEIKRKIGENASAVDEIAGLLEISSDSAYRRIRGEKLISLDELYKLCSHYKISLDQVVGTQTDSFLFQGQLIDSKTYRYEEYLMTTLQWMTYFNSFKEKEFYYLCKDMPIFHHFYFRELASFKYYFWMRTVFHFPDFNKRKFRVDDYPDESFLLGNKILATYNQMPCVEIWNLESINTMMRQMEYCRDNQMFDSDNEALKVYDALEKYFDHLQKQAELGYKYDMSDPGKKALGGFKMYFNEWILLDNNMMVILDHSRLSVVPHSAINYMICRDVAFTNKQYQYIQNLMQRSTQISEVSEKERSRFFRILRERIDKRKEALKV